MKNKVQQEKGKRKITHPLFYPLKNIARKRKKNQGTLGTLIISFFSSDILLRKMEMTNILDLQWMEKKSTKKHETLKLRT